MMLGIPLHMGSIGKSSIFEAHSEQCFFKANTEIRMTEETPEMLAFRSEEP